MTLRSLHRIACLLLGLEVSTTIAPAPAQAWLTRQAPPARSVPAKLVSPEGRVTLQADARPLAEVLDTIGRQAGLRIMYGEDVIASMHRVTLDVRDALPLDALREAVRGTGLHVRRVLGDAALITDAEGVTSTDRMMSPVRAMSLERVTGTTSATRLVPRRQGTVTGEVVDASTARPVSGVVVEIVGADRSTLTGDEGRFTFAGVPAGSYRVRVSVIGYLEQEQEVTVMSEQTVTLRFELQPEALALEELVAVGYGTERRENLTGAVDHITTEQLENRPITSVAQGLQGMSPNLNIVFESGQPGEKADFNIRGTTSINGGSPLILVDGVPGDPSLINPQDIESVSVLKDAASAAIYGARGAFGVILITTKQGTRQQPQFTYSANLATSTPTIMPQAVTDPYTSMYLYNEAYKGYAEVEEFTPEELEYARQRSEDPSLPAVVVEETSGGKSYQYFGTTDWFDEMYRESHPVMQHSLSVSGRESSLRYYLSGGYLDEAGVFNYDSDSFRKYNLRAKLDLDVTPWLSLGNNLTYSRGDYEFPTLWGNSVDIWRYVAVTGQARFPVRNPDGTWTSSGAYLGFFQDGGRGMNRERLLQNSVSAELSLLDGRWRIAGDYTYQTDGYDRDEQYLQIPYSSTPDVISMRGVDRVIETNTDNYYHILNLFTEYTQQLGLHSLKGLVGFNQELRTFSGFRARGDGAIGGQGSLDLTTGEQTVDSWASEWALRGVFYRLNYGFDGRYLLELNGRYDGTSRFPEGDRFGFFPSASAAWQLSRETFFEPLRPVVGDLKLRASYGSLGNQSVSTYAYIPTMSSNRSNVIIDGQRPITVGPPGLVSPMLTWEKATTLDLGVDASFLDDRLGLVFDWYVRETTDMLTKGRTLPAVLGADEPDENAADLETKGWELALNWRDQLGDVLGSPFSYGLGVVLADHETVITRFDNPNGFLGDYYVGMKLGEIWGYETEGFFQSEEELANHADQSEVERFPERRRVGDLKFRDRNGDGMISPGDNTLENPGDQFIIGNSTPRYSYGITGSFDWKNISFSVFFQGIGKRDYYPGSETAYFWSVYNRPYNTALEHLVENHWTPENPDAYFPRLKAYIALQDGKDLAAPQTRYLQDASYLRLKNVTIGYTLPQRLVSRAGLDRLQIYLSGENLWEHTDLRVPVDPELLLRSHNWGDGQKYPFQRSFSLGFNVTF